MAVLRPLLETCALRDAVDVDGARDAATAVVAELPGSHILLQGLDTWSCDVAGAGAR